jgi:hypothetical protein
MTPGTGAPEEPTAVERLDRAVSEYTSAHLNLGDDLKHLDRVQQVGAPEGTINAPAFATLGSDQHSLGRAGATGEHSGTLGALNACRRIEAAS